MDSGGDDLDVVERKLRALGDDAAVEGDEGAAVVVEAVAVAALLVRVQVQAAGLRLERCQLLWRSNWEENSP